MPEETNIERLIVNILTQEQYDEMKLAGEINENELYLTPSEDSGSLGDLSALTTTIKTTLVAAINEVNGRITTELGDIETALEALL